MQILKQKENSPMPVEEQVALIFAATRGLLDRLPAADIRRFEEELVKHLHAAHAELLKDIREKKVISDEATLERTIRNFAESFAEGRAAEMRSFS